MNHFSPTDTYPIPLIEIFLLIFLAEVFCYQLDLLNAFLQLSLDDQSKQYLTINTHKGLITYLLAWHLLPHFSNTTLTACFRA